MAGRQRSLNELRGMRLFAEVVSSGSFRAAADRLGLPVSTVSRHLKQLERDVGLQLIIRTTRQMHLTDSGQLYMERCVAILEEVDRAYEDLSQIRTQPVGVLRISTPAELALAYLEPLLGEFAALHPKLTLSLDLNPHIVDLAADKVDVAIRVGRLDDSGLIARPVARLRRGLFASPRYVLDRGDPQHPDELLTHDCLPFASAPWLFTHAQTGVQASVDPRVRLLANSPSLQLRFALRGMGIVRLPERIVRHELAQGQLVPVMASWRADSLSIHALTTTRALPAKVRLFIDFLTSRFGSISQD